MPTDLYEPKTYGRATKGTGPALPVLDDDNYRAIVKDVKQGPGYQNEGEQYVIEFELLDEKKDNGEPLTLRGYIRIPDGVINDGVLNEKSTLYAFIKALGYADDDMEIDPAAWQGEEIRITVQNKEIKEGENKGQTRPRITGYLLKKGSGQKQAQAARERTSGSATAPAADF